MAFSTKVITDESQVPEGYVRICEISPSNTEQKRISEAHQDGLIAAVKLMRSTRDTVGPVWVHKESAVELLRRHKERATLGLPVASVPASADPELLSVLLRLTLAVERIAEAAESMATVPQSFR